MTHQQAMTIARQEAKAARETQKALVVNRPNDRGTDNLFNCLTTVKK